MLVQILKFPGMIGIDRWGEDDGNIFIWKNGLDVLQRLVSAVGLYQRILSDEDSRFGNLGGVGSQKGNR